MSTTTKAPVMRFVTLGGAHVAVHAGPDGRTWQCQGCDAGTDFAQSVTAARQEANNHAGLCRAVPKDAA